MARLGDFVRIKTGKLDANAASDDGKYPFFTCAIDPLHINTFSYDCECVLVTGNGDLNVKYYKGKFDAYQRTYIIESIDKKILSVRYLFYFLDQYIETLRKQAIGGVIKYIKLGNLTEAEIPLPSLELQEKYVCILDSVQELLNKHQQQRTILNQLVKSQFIEMFGNIEKAFPLSNVGTITGGLTKNAKREKMELHLPYLRVANVFFAHIDTNEILEIGLTAEERDKTLLKDGDLLFVEGNGSPDQIGRVAIWHNEVPNCVHQNHLIKVRFDPEKILPEFAMHYFMTQDGRNQIKKVAVSTSGLYTLSVSKIGNLVMPVPSLKRQEQFVALAQQADKSKSTIQQSLDTLTTLKKSLMQTYFG